MSSSCESGGKNRSSESTVDADVTMKESTGEITWLHSLTVFCSDVSVVGLRYAVNPSHSPLRRSVWVLLLLSGAAFTVYQIQERVRHYLSFPVNVNFWEEHMEEMRFPTVTVCNENRASLAKMSALGKRHLDISTTCTLVF